MEQELPLEAGAEAAADYVPMIMRAMEANDIGIRTMALRSGIKKSRLGTILHRDPEKRASMTLPEFQAILRALNIDLMQAVISVEMTREMELVQDDRFTALVAMLSTLFKGLPHRLVEALQELEGMDGSEIRSEWGTYFQSAVIKRMVSVARNSARGATRFSSAAPVRSARLLRSSTPWRRERMVHGAVPAMHSSGWSQLSKCR